MTIIAEAEALRNETYDIQVELTKIEIKKETCPNCGTRAICSESDYVDYRDNNRYCGACLEYFQYIYKERNK